MFGKLKTGALYIRVKRNKFIIRNPESGEETVLAASQGFTSKRLLVGEFSHAQSLLTAGLNKVSGGIFSPSPVVVIHPLEMTEGGLSEVEERVFRELAIGSGARKVVIWIGHDLSDDEVKEKAAEFSSA